MALVAYAGWQSSWPGLRVLGYWLGFATAVVVLWFGSGSWVLALSGVALWFVVPCTQALALSRKLRFSRRRRLVAGPIDFEEFPEINRVSRDVRGEGFRALGDYWVKPSPFEQGYRLFAHGEDPILAAAAVVRQGALSMHYHVLLTPDTSGQAWLTWDYPLAYGLKMPPEFQVYRCVDAEDWPQLLEQHRAFLAANGVAGLGLATEQEGVKLFDQLLRGVLRHNLELGILKKEDGDEVAYSWKGSLMVGWQVFREMVGG